MHRHHVVQSLEHPCGVTLECAVGNIGYQPDIEALVNVAQPPPHPIAPGQAIMTTSHQLRNRFAIHSPGPASANSPAADVVLAGCYRNALMLAAEHGVTSIAFPAISTGPSGYPIEAAARVACRAIVTALTMDTTVRLVRFVLRTAQDARVHWRAFDEALAAYRHSLESPALRPVTAGWRRRR